jgi:potassium efflux system protein
MNRKTVMPGGATPVSLAVRVLVVLGLALWLSGMSPARAQDKGSAPTRVEAPLSSPEALPRILATGAAALEKQINEWQSRVAESGENLAQAKEDGANLRVAVAAVQASLAVTKPPLSQVQDLLATYSSLESALKSRSKDLAQEAAELTKTREDEIRSLNTLRTQMNVLQGKEAEGLSPELEQSYTRYLQLADARDRLVAQVLDNLEARRRTLESQRQLAAETLPPLKKLEESWQAELLRRQAQQVPFKEQVARVWGSVAALPGRVWRWCSDLVAARTLSAFFWSHLAHLLGLLSFILLIGWSTRWLNRWVTERFRRWRAAAPDLHLLPLLVLGLILISNLFLLGLIFWVGLFFWIFGMLGSTPAQLVLAVLVTLWILRLGLQSVQAYIGGRPAGVALPLDQATARFYCRTLKVFWVYLFLGFLGLKAAALLGFPPASLQFLEHFFQVGIFLWILWSMRRPHLTRLLPALPDPAWVRRPEVTQAIRGLVLFLLALIVLADLLGFQNLSIYLAQGGTWTGLAVALLWLLWLVAATILHHLLHPEEGWAPRRYPEQQEMLQKLYATGRWLLSVLLGAGVVLWSLDTWGIKPETIAGAFQWVTWGPALGPMRLNILNLGGAVLAVYLGIVVSRVIRGLMAVKIFPRTGLDLGVQYTISTTLHYVVLILAAMVALNILGFPLTNLALVAGALGVGIGFGLQNIVNNFLSGLILLFERPIKVGDLLVIDGQWGTVKEIRVRSTVFETFDRYVLIIPNSELVSGKVLNWTHYGRGINRLTLKVGVSYGSDVGQVTRLLTEVCQANPRVVDHPPPQVYFAVYGDSSLDFTVWVHLRTPDDRIPATHELNSAIFETLREHGIEIPFPQRDLHIKEWPGEPGRKLEE